MKMGGEICQRISMIYDSAGGRTQDVFSERIDLLSLLMTFYSRPFPLLSELPSAIHNLADSYLINHCSYPHLGSIMTIRLNAGIRVC